MKSNNYYLLTLGCAKNSVDSESMAQLLDTSGYIAVADPTAASVLIVNTCGFIGPARAESMRTLRELADSKSKEQTLIAAGCLSQIWGPQIVAEVPGIDGVIGTRRWMDIVEFTDKLRATKHPE
ncbi:MAG TPA: 30S ribosomal protein S12 methylthiotransferase RimO, partial [Anaerolineae bacterium]|nr:30S ribosomal protein S12 methylthiotransferase RimO [Anaerolineae bacterium]